MHWRQIVAYLLLALAAVSLAGALALSQTGPPAPAAGESTKSGKAAKKEKPKEEEGPKVVRWVCTDRICGGCDGECSHHGHVATHQGGHCACTPNEGSELDKAIRKAFQGHEKGQ